MNELALKYGCNPNQKPSRIFMQDGKDLPVEVLNGKPGYINFLDAFNSWQLVKELKAATGLPAAASFKHVSPAGAAVAHPLSDVERKVCMVPDDLELSPIAQAYVRARGCDRVSSFGDFAALSDECDASVAKFLVKEVSDGIIAPSYTDDALEILKAKRRGNYLIIKMDPDYQPEEMETKHEELNLGDIMSDSYIYSVEHSENYNGTPVDVAVVPSGCVRDTYTKGNITVEDVYNSFSLGIGKDGLAGYPLIDVYLTGKELKLAAEVDASVSDFMTTARLYCSGLNFTFNPHRMILNKVTDCYLTREDGERIEIQDDQLYRVVTDLYTGQMLGSVMEMSYGLLKIEPKDKDGNPIENLENQAIMEGDKELKAWDAIARYMQSFDDTDGNGISNVPEYYETTHGRKVVDESRNVIDLVKNPNKFSVMIVGIVLVLILIIILLVVLIRKLIKKRRRKKK